jgi:predicted MFS family arabinose efflux permease
VPTGWRLDAVYLYIIAWLLPTLLLGWRYFPKDPGDRPSEGRFEWRNIAKPGAAAILGAMLYWIMIGAVWGYLEGFAREAGLSLPEIGRALSIGLVVSLIGSFASAWMGVRYGRAMPLLISAIAQIGCLFLLTRLARYQNPVIGFYVINTIFQIFWSYVVTYFIIVSNDVDRSGRFLAFWGTACHAPLAVGPYVGALLRWFGIAMAFACYLASSARSGSHAARSAGEIAIREIPPGPPRSRRHREAEHTLERDQALGFIEDERTRRQAGAAVYSPGSHLGIYVKRREHIKVSMLMESS